ncbi:hypothetical protein [Methylobacterium brachiatum]|nr:hypothetical protein [Methylobacterium brachiatum]
MSKPAVTRLHPDLARFPACRSSRRRSPIEPLDGLMRPLGGG